MYREKEECVGKKDGERWGNRGSREEGGISTMHLKDSQVGKEIIEEDPETGWRECKEERYAGPCRPCCTSKLQCTYNEPLDGPVVRVHHELCQRAELCGAVPPITAVDKCAAAALIHAASNERGPLWDTQHTVNTTSKERANKVCNLQCVKLEIVAANTVEPFYRGYHWDPASLSHTESALYRKVPLYTLLLTPLNLTVAANSYTHT